jgi:diaminopimelate decarboxylase
LSESPIAVREGRLWIEELSATELADRFGTPLYVVSEAKLRANARLWISELARVWPEGPTAVMPSLKANTSMALRLILNDEALGCDVFGRNELELALKAAVRVEKISLSGATKSDGLLALALDRGVKLTVDSLDELERLERIAAKAGKPAAIRLRLRPWLAASPALSDYSTKSYPAHLAVQDYRAGMPTAEACEGAALAHSSTHLDLAGVAAHVTRQTTDESFWAAFGAEMAALIGTIREQIPGWRPREINLGGGYAVPRDPAARALDVRRNAPLAPEPADYLSAVVEPLRAGLREQRVATQDIRLEIEPGRAIYGDAGVHLTTVRHVKTQREPVPRVWIETDTSEAFLADTVIERNDWTIVPAQAHTGDETIDAAVTGISCGWDQLSRPGSRPNVGKGDVMAFLDTGAYQDATSSNFNAMGRPATVLVNGKDADVIKTAETLDDLLAREQVPPRLRGAED